MAAGRQFKREVGSFLPRSGYIRVGEAGGGMSVCHKSGLTNALNTHTQAHTHAQGTHLHKETEEQ